MGALSPHHQALLLPFGLPPVAGFGVVFTYSAVVVVVVAAAAVAVITVLTLSLL